MTKTFTLLLLFIGNMFLSFSKSGFQLIDINPAAFDNSTAKSNTSDFRFDNTDYLVVQPKNNSSSYLTENGFNVESYLGDGCYLITTAATNTKSILQSIQTSKIGYISFDSKIDETLNSSASPASVSVLYLSLIHI